MKLMGTKRKLQKGISKLPIVKDYVCWAGALKKETLEKVLKKPKNHQNKYGLFQPGVWRNKDVEVAVKG